MVLLRFRHFMILFLYQREGCDVLEKKRILGLDILRVFAIVFVFITHAINIRGVLNGKIKQKN